MGTFTHMAFCKMVVIFEDKQNILSITPARRENMLIAAQILFAIAAVIGITLAFMHIKKKPVPIAYALPHGIIAATGLILVIISYVQAIAAVGLPLILFIIAALGGFVLFATHYRARPLPLPLIIIHALVAVTAFIILIYRANVG